MVGKISPVCWHRLERMAVQGRTLLRLGFFGPHRHRHTYIVVEWPHNDSGVNFQSGRKSAQKRGKASTIFLSFSFLILYWNAKRSIQEFSNLAEEIKSKLPKDLRNPIRDHSSITSSKRWVGGVRKWQFVMIYCTVNHQRVGWVGLKKSKTWWRKTWMVPYQACLLNPITRPAYYRIFLGLLWAFFTSILFLATYTPN